MTREPESEPITEEDYKFLRDERWDKDPTGRREGIKGSKVKFSGPAIESIIDIVDQFPIIQKQLKDLQKRVTALEAGQEGEKK